MGVIINSFAGMMERAQTLGPLPVAVAAADDPTVLASLVAAQQTGIVTPFLVGDESVIRAIAAREGLDLSGMTIADEADREETACKVVSMAREGKAAVVVKGQIKTADLLKPVLDRDRGLRASDLLSHVAVFETSVCTRLLYISDGGVIPRPTWEQKVQIIHNVVDITHRFGVEQPKVAVLGANERFDPGMPVGAESLIVAGLAQKEWGDRAIVEGPMGVDLALNPLVALQEGIDTDIPGTADILIMPSVEAGNIMGKGMMYFANARSAAMIVGARVPILINSRADDAETRLLSLGLAVIWAAQVSNGLTSSVSVS